MRSIERITLSWQFLVEITQMLKFTALPIGIVLIVFVLFSYEDEEKKFRSWLDDAWVFLADKEREWEDRLSSFINALIGGLRHSLEQIYGQNLFSFRSYVASTLSCASIGILVSISNVGALLFPLHGALLFSLILLLPFFFKRHFYALAVAALLGTNLFLYFHWEGRLGAWDIPLRGEDPVQLFIVVLAVASIIDYLFIATTRWYLKRVAETRHLLSKCGYLLLTVVSGCVLLLIAFILTLDFFFAFCVGAIFITLSFTFVLVSAIIFGIGVSVLPRSLYLAIKLRIFENKKTSVSIGIFLIGIPFPQAASAIKEFSKILLG